MDTGTRSTLTPEESLAIIKRTLGQARRELIMPDGPIAKAWGAAVTVGFAGMFVVWSTKLSEHHVAAGLVIGLVWLLALAAALWYSSRRGKAYYSPKGGGVWSPVMARLLWI